MKKKRKGKRKKNLIKIAVDASFLFVFLDAEMINQVLN